MPKRRVKRKKQFNINGLLSVLILLTLLAIAYMLFEEKIKTFFTPVEREKVVVVEETLPKTEDVLPSNYDNSWFINNSEQYKKYNLTTEYIINVTEPLTKLTVKFPIAQHQKTLQYVYDVKMIPEATRVYTENGNKYFEYVVENVTPQLYTITLSSDVAVRTYDINTAKKINLNLRPEANKSRYLMSEKNINVNSEYLKQVANNIGGSTQEEIVLNIYNYIQQNVKYTLNTNAVDAEQVLKEKKAFCVGFSSLMTALCRIKNIPARIVAGNIIKNGKNSKHNWVEVYYPQYGWVAYDPTFFVYSQNNKIKIQKDGIKTPINDYFILGYNISESWGVEMESDREIHNPVSMDYSFKVRQIQ